MTRFVWWCRLAVSCVLVGLTALSILHAQSGGRQGETRPDFSTDDQTRLEAEQISDLVTQLTYQSLQSHANSAASIPNFGYADDGQYFTVRFTDSGQTSRDLDYVYVLDKRNLTYSAVEMTGASQDITNLSTMYRRYQNHADSPTLGQTPPTDAALRLRMSSLVSQMASDRAGRDAKRLQLWADNPQAQQMSCLGGGEIEMNHVDVVQIILFSTYASNDWAHQPGVPPVSIPLGICWADPDTAAGTSWYTSSCTMYHSVAPMASSVRVVHRAYNYDFGLPHLATFGLHNVITGVNATTGYAYATGYATDWGEAHWLIWGRIGLRRAIC